MQVIVTLAGLRNNFSEKGFSDPQALIKACGRPVISYLIHAFPTSWKLIFVLDEKDKTTSLESTILKMAAGSEVVYTSKSDRGLVDSVLAGAQLLNSEEGVIVTSSDLAPIWKSHHFEKVVAESKCEMASINYQGVHPIYLGPSQYCHVQTDGNNLVTKLQENVMFTGQIEKEVTAAGIFYFKNKSFLQEALDEQIKQNLNSQNKFSISLALQAMLNKKPSIKILDYRIDHLVQLSSPADIERFDFWFNYIYLSQSPKAFSHIETNRLPLNQKPEDFKKEKQYWYTVLINFDLIPF